MVQRVQVIFVDDISGDEVASDGDTVQFALDGVQYEIDLTAANAAKLRDALQTYIEHGRRTSGQKATARSAARRSTKADPAQLAAIRSWARRAGYKVSDRGRISNEITEEFEKAH